IALMQVFALLRGGARTGGVPAPPRSSRFGWSGRAGTMPRPQAIEFPTKPLLHCVDAGERLTVSNNEALKDVCELASSVEDDFDLGGPPLGVRIDHLKASELRGESQHAEEVRVLLEKLLCGLAHILFECCHNAHRGGIRGN